MIIKRAGIILNCNQRFVLVKSNTNKKWSFPKGHIEPDEETNDCAFREFKEETGIDLEKEDIHLMKTKIIGDTMYFYYNSCDPSLVERDFFLDQNEIIEANWFTIAEMKEIDERGCNIGVRVFISTDQDYRAPTRLLLNGGGLCRRNRPDENGWITI